MKTKKINILAAAAIAAAGFTGQVGAASAPFTLLPTPENNANATYGQYKDGSGNLRDAILMNGIPIAFKYDAFWSYSAKVLDTIQGSASQPVGGFLPSATYGSFDFTTGTGTIAINLTSGASGATNLNPNGSGVNFQNPVEAASNNNVLGWTGSWGGNAQERFSSPVDTPNGKDYSEPAALNGGTSTVGNMLTYLHSLNPLASIPVIYADYNQAGKLDSLFVSARVEIQDAATNAVKASWNLDRNNNGTLDLSDPTYNYGQLTFLGSASACAADPYHPLTNPDGCAGVTANGDDYIKLEHNKGSGKPDFLVYAPDMDLNQYLATDLFVVKANVGCLMDATGAFVVAPLDGNTLGCNTNGFEEFGIVGALASSKVPEPSTMVLAGLGLLGLSRMRRNRA